VLTQRVEDDTGLEHGNVDHVGPGSRGRVGMVTRLGAVGLRLGLVPLDDPVADVLDQEGKKEAGHEDGRGRTLICKLAEALVPKHQAGVGIKLFAC